jgi:cold shock protein
MPVRIYDISKKLGLENKEVLAKAKELGIAQARVASSQLDKITAEYLEQQLGPNPPPALTVMPTSPGANGESGLAQEGFQKTRPPGITIQTTSPEIHDLVQRILLGEVPFVVEISREAGGPPLRVTLGEHGGLAAPATVASKPRPEPPPRAELDERTKDLFRAAYYSARHVSKDDWVNLAEYGSALKRLDSTFQPQDFGERSLGGLIRRMIEDFDIKSDGSTPPVYFIRMKPHAVNSQPTPQAATPVMPQPTQPRRRATGRIHNLKLGFGFIAPDDGSDNVFFHSTEVVGCTIFDLRPGDPVEFEFGVNERGPAAWKVKRLS